MHQTAHSFAAKVGRPQVLRQGVVDVLQPAISTASSQGPRSSLEDTVAAWQLFMPGIPMTRAAVLMVLDGVGGAAGGHLASATGAWSVGAGLQGFAISQGAPYMTEEGGNYLSPGAVAHVVGDVMSRANADICELAASHALYKQMATTAVVVVVWGDTATIGWCGDSRAYRFSASGELAQLTQDHSIAQQLVDRGVLRSLSEATPQEIATICNYLGRREGAEPEIAQFELSEGEWILACSDGLTGVVDDGRIRALLHQARSGQIPFDRIASELVEAALQSGATDNVTACVYRHAGATQPSEPRDIDAQHGARTRATISPGYAAMLAAALHTHSQKEMFS